MERGEGGGEGGWWANGQGTDRLVRWLTELCLASRSSFGWAQGLLREAGGGRE